MQNLSSVAPPPLPGEVTEITHDMPTLVPARSQALRALGLVMVIGGAVGLALVLVASHLRSAPAAQLAVAPAPPVLPAAPQPPVQAQEAPATKMEAARSTKMERRAKRATGAGPTVEANVMSIRISAGVAPVRATPDPDAKVVCSVKRGVVMRSLQQTPGTKARWFAVHCDKDSPGWVHENFLSVKP